MTELAHIGVKGMKWGVRKAQARTSSAPAKKMTVKQQAEAHEQKQVRRQAHVKMGKEVTKAVLIAVGTIAISSVAGPVVAAGAGAIARSLPGPVFSTVTTSTKSEVANVRR